MDGISITADAQCTPVASLLLEHEQGCKAEDADWLLSYDRDKNHAASLHSPASTTELRSAIILIVSMRGLVNLVQMSDLGPHLTAPHNEITPAINAQIDRGVRHGAKPREGAVVMEAASQFSAGSQQVGWASFFVQVHDQEHDDEAWWHHCEGPTLGPCLYTQTEPPNSACMVHWFL